MAACAPLYVKMTRDIDVFFDSWYYIGAGGRCRINTNTKKEKEKKRELIDIPILEQHKYNRTQDFVQTKHDDSLSTSFSNN